MPGAPPIGAHPGLGYAPRVCSSAANGAAGTRRHTLLRINSSLVTRMLVSVAAFGVLVFVLAGGIELWRERGDLTQAARARADAALGLSSPPIALALWNYDLATLDLLARNLVRDGA